MLNINVRHLHYLVALAETGSFSRAADRVGVTQSTLSAAIQSLEMELGAPLVDRSGRKIQMLPSGEAVVRQARDIIVRIQELPEHAAEAARPLTTPAAPLRASSMSAYRPTIGDPSTLTSRTRHIPDAVRAIRAVCKGIGEEVTYSHPWTIRTDTGPVLRVILSASDSRGPDTL